MRPSVLTRLAIGTVVVVLGMTVPCAVGAQQAAVTTKDESLEALSEEANDPTASLSQAQLKDIFTPAEFGTNAQPNTVQFRPIFSVLPHGPLNLKQIVRPTSLW